MNSQLDCAMINNVLKPSVLLSPTNFDISSQSFDDALDAVDYNADFLARASFLDNEDGGRSPQSFDAPDTPPTYADAYEADESGVVGCVAASREEDADREIGVADRRADGVTGPGRTSNGSGIKNKIRCDLRAGGGGDWLATRDDYVRILQNSDTLLARESEEIKEVDMVGDRRYRAMGEHILLGGATIDHTYTDCYPTNNSSNNSQEHNDVNHRGSRTAREESGEKEEEIVEPMSRSVVVPLRPMSPLTPLSPHDLVEGTQVSRT